MTTPIFTPKPDATSSLIERLEWLTNLETARDGTEFARAVRMVPRHRLEFSAYIRSADDKNSISILQAGGQVLLPLWPHVERYTGAPTPSRGYGYRLGHEAAFLTLSGGSLAEFSGTYPSGYILPAAVARLDSNVQLTRLTSDLAVARLGFRLVDFSEEIDTDVSLALPERHDWTVSVDDTTDETSETFDTATALVVERHYAKRVIKISIMARSFEAVTALRRFFFAVRGRANTFAYALAGEPEQQWRLGTDAVEIEYLKTSLARVQLTLIQQ